MDDKGEVKSHKKRYTSNDELTQKLKGIVNNKPLEEELKYNENKPQ